jgi:hypothetical protein
MAEPHHKLEETALGTSLEKAFEGLKQGPSRNSLIGIGVVVVLALLVWFGYYLWNSSVQSSSSRWAKLDGLVFPELVPELLQEPNLRDTAQARLGRYIEARYKLRSGLRTLASENSETKAQARKQIEDGTKIYDDLLKSEKSAVLREEALLGAAKGYETLNDRARAIERYQQLAKEFPNTPTGRDAAQQAKRLEDPANQKVLDELATQLLPKS